MTARRAGFSTNDMEPRFELIQQLGKLVALALEGSQGCRTSTTYGPLLRLEICKSESRPDVRASCRLNLPNKMN